MSPSGLSWLQGCLFFFLGVAASYGLNRCQNRRTNHETSDVGSITILVDNGITPTPVNDAQSSGSDEEARPPSNHSNPFGEAMASTWSLSFPDRNRLRSESLGHDPRSVLECLGATGQTSHFMEFVAETEAPNFARTETAYNTIAADMTSSPMSSTTAGLLRSSGDEDEALSPSHPAGETMALPGTLSCPDRKRYQFDTCGMEERTKSPFEKFMAKDEARKYPLMYEPEIPVEPPQDYYRNDYPSGNHQQMNQIYFDDVPYGSIDYNFIFARQDIPFFYYNHFYQGTEYPSHQISADIRLSRREFINNHLIIRLQQEGLHCEIRGSVITVSGYPADDGPNGFLALVKQISGDRGASIEEEKGHSGLKEKLE